MGRVLEDKCYDFMIGFVFLKDVVFCSMSDRLKVLVVDKVVRFRMIIIFIWLV